jgi:hypothetical protein
MEHAKQKTCANLFAWSSRTINTEMKNLLKNNLEKIFGENNEK